MSTKQRIILRRYRDGYSERRISGQERRKTMLRSKENTGSRLWNGQTGAINRDPVLCIWRQKELSQSFP